jgi:hypothetical protein
MTGRNVQGQPVLHTACYAFSSLQDSNISGFIKAIRNCREGIKELQTFKPHALEKSVSFIITVQCKSHKC